MNTPKDTKETPAKKPAAKKTPPAAGHAKKEMPKTAAAPQAKPATKKPQAKPIAGNTVTVRQIRSVNRQPETYAATLRGLGLGKIRRERTLEDTPAVRGMIRKMLGFIEIVEPK